MSALTYLFCAAPAEEHTVQSPVSVSSFSMGLGPISTLSRRERIAEAKQKRMRMRMRIRMQMQRRHPVLPATFFLKPIMFKIDFSRKNWLLSVHGIHFRAVHFLMNAGNTFPEIYITIMRKKRRQQNHFLRYKTYLPNEPSIPLLNEYKQIAMKNQAMIRSFRCIARRWMRSKLTMKNTEDLVTGEIPVVPLRLVDWRTRSTYVFEARTIARDSITRLTLSRCDFFPSPKLPRNPYTNEILTEGQFYSLVRQLRAAGETHWSIEALYSAKYNLVEFDGDMYSKIKRTIHNSVFANPCGDVGKRILLEYISEEHDYHKQPYEEDIYEWAIENAAHHYTIHAWRVQCKRYYSVVHFPEGPDKDLKEKQEIDSATKRLCAFPAALVEKYDAVHEKKYVKLEDRAAVAISDTQYEWVVVAVIPATVLEFLPPGAASGDSDDSAT